MHNDKDQFNPGLAAGQYLGGYNLKSVIRLEEIEAFYYELVHPASGARHIHISRNDPEKTFGVAFKTVPTDSTGVAHILEHTVLCGSKKFPVRDPFFSMLKRSLSTFMNAFTAPDWTMYPFSTQNQKDFYNLMTVYLDAAFFPNLEELSFKQEGHRLEIEGDLKAGAYELVYKGVVYNEMKGAMSSPDQVLVRSLLKALYPQTTYSYNSGGDPREIPRLTHTQLLLFHQRHYHPSNAFFYSYGDFALKDHLGFIEEKILSRFQKTDPRTDVPSQPRWEKPQTATFPYPLAENEDPTKKFQVCVAWLTADIRNSFEILTLVLLEEILLGNPASPLRKALIDSGLGTALSDGTGFVSDHKDTLFACGLKDVEQSAASAIEATIFEVLRNLTQNGIPKELIEAAIHQIEFQRKEVTNTPFPYGLKLLLAFAGTWIHGGDPLKILQFDADLKRLKQELVAGPFFETRIKSYFLENPHRVLFTLVPDQALATKETEQVVAQLRRIKQDLAQSDLETIQRATKSLRARRETKEDVNCLPTLEINDIPPEVQTIKPGPPKENAPAVIYRQPTSGILYLAGAAGVGDFAQDLIPLLPFFAVALPKSGTQKHDYVEMSRRIDAYTGGIGLSVHARTGFDGGGRGLPFLALHAKCLNRNQAKMTDIIEELLTAYDFSDLKHLKRLLLEYRAQMEAAVIHNGHRLAISLAARNFSPACTLSENWGGIQQLRAIKELTDDLSEARLKATAEKLVKIGNSVFQAGNIRLALIAEEAALASGQGLLTDSREFSRLAYAADDVNLFAFPELSAGEGIPREGWSTSTAVSFVAQVFETQRMQHKDSPALAVIAKMLRSLYLHREIREKGGAYGGFAIYNPENGLFAFGSYRDPHIVTTLAVYDRAADFIKSGNYADADVKEAILQVCAEIDKPDPPGPAAKKAFYREIIALSDEKRLQFKQQLLSVTHRDVGEVAAKYFQPDRKDRAVAVISGEDKLKAANQKLGHSPLALYRI